MMTRFLSVIFGGVNLAEEWWHNMPDLIWSGLVGALIALVSALLASWANSRRQKQQLDHDLAQKKAQFNHDEERQRIQLSHDSEEHRIGREMSLRRDVYLAAAEATGSLQEYISHSTRSEVPEADRLALVKGSTGVLNKVHLVGSNTTIKAFSYVQLTFARGIFRVEEQRLAILKANLRIDALKREVENLQKQRAALVETAKASGGKPEELRQEFRSVSEDIERHIDEVSREHERLLALQLELTQKAAEANLAVQEAFASAVVTVRAELGLAIDSQDYQVAMAQYRSLLRTELSGFIERVRAEADSE